MGCSSSKNNSSSAVALPSPSPLSPPPPPSLSKPSLSTPDSSASQSKPTKQISSAISQETLTQRITDGDPSSLLESRNNVSSQDDVPSNPTSDWTDGQNQTEVHKDPTPILLETSRFPSLPSDSKKFISKESSEMQGDQLEVIVTSELDEPLTEASPEIIPLKEDQQDLISTSHPPPDSTQNVVEGFAREEETNDLAHKAGETAPSVSDSTTLNDPKDTATDSNSSQPSLATDISPQIILIQRMWRGSLTRLRHSRRASLEHSAAISLQSFWKRCALKKIAKQQATQRLCGVIRIQTTTRRYLSCKLLNQLRQEARERLRLITSAIHAQRIWRSYRDRQLVRLLTENLLKERRELAAKKIQTRLRILLSQRILKALQLIARQALETTSAVCLQKAFRCHRSRCKLARLRQELLHNSSALLLQRIWRGRIDRNLYRILLLAHQHSLRRASCALRLQCAWRCHRSFQALTLLRRLHIAKRVLCATRIQTKARQRIARRIVATHRHRQRVRVASSLRIQTAYRCHRSRSLLRQLQQEAAVQRVQNAWRVSKAKQKVKRLQLQRFQLREMSAVALQCAWRCAVSRFSLQLLRQQQQELRRVASTKIQTCVRGWLAVCLLQTLRSNALLSLRHRSATLIQTHFRRFVNRLTLSHLRQEHLLALAILRETQQRQHERDMSLRIQRTFRGYCCRQLLNQQRAIAWASPLVIKVMRRVPYVMRFYHPHCLELTLREAKGLNTGSGNGKPNAYAIVGAFSDASKMKSSGGFLGTLKTKTMLCYCKSKPIPNTSSPVWRSGVGAGASQDGASLLISPASWNSRIVVTLMHSASAFSFSKDSCLGQVSIDVRQYPQLYRGELVEITDLPLSSYTFPVVNPETREDLSLHSSASGPQGNSKSKGCISFTLRLPLLASSMCGWVWRASTFALTRGQFKRRWMVLMDHTLRFYKDPFSLNDCKGEVECADVLDIVDGEDEEGGAVVEVHYGGGQAGVQQQHGGRGGGEGGEGGGECWVLRWDRLSPPYTRVMWRQKLFKSCKHIRQL